MRKTPAFDGIARHIPVVLASDSPNDGQAKPAKLMRRVGDEAAGRRFIGLGPLKGCLERIDHAIERTHHLPELGVGVRRRMAAAEVAGRDAVGHRGHVTEWPRRETRYD